jgi:hypothetical protein
MHRGDHRLADLLFERAAARYREELAVEPLARLRAHQMISRVRSLENPERASELCLDAERMVARLNRIESLEPPFERVDARTLLANWMHDSRSDRAARPLEARPSLAA